jgi:hypothetical protein
MPLSEGHTSDHKGAALILAALPPAKELLADRGYDSNWFRAGLAERGITASIPPTKSSKAPIAQSGGRATMNATESRTPSAGSRTGGGSSTRYDCCARPSASSLRSRSGCRSEC